MINSAILFLPQSSCLCLRAFILSLQEQSQLARGHGKIALLVSINIPHQWTHLSVFCLAQFPIWNVVWLWVNRDHHLRKDDLLKIVLNIKLRYGALSISLWNLSLFLYKNYRMRLCLCIIFDFEHLCHVQNIMALFLWEKEGENRRWSKETSERENTMPCCQPSTFLNLLCTKLD